MSCPIEIERRVLCAAENAAMASLPEEGHKENYLSGQRNIRMSFHYKCTNLHLDGADYIHFFHVLFPFYPFFLTTILSHLIIIHKIPQSGVSAVREREKLPIKRSVSLSLIQRSFLSS